MRLYPKATMISDIKKKKFNMRLSRARRVVENAFGILAMKWRVFLRSKETDLKTTECIVKAACCLHNYIMIKNNNTLIESEEKTETIRALSDMRSTNRRTNTAAFEIREQFASHFNK